MIFQVPEFDGRMDEWMDRWMDRWMVRWAVGMRAFLEKKTPQQLAVAAAVQSSDSI